MICFPGFVPIKAPLLKIDSSFPLTHTIQSVVIYAFKKNFLHLNYERRIIDYGSYRNSS